MTLWSRSSEVPEKVVDREFEEIGVIGHCKSRKARTVLPGGIKQDTISSDESAESSVEIDSKKAKHGNAGGWKINPAEFEKDDSNVYFDFIEAFSTLSAKKYSIPIADRLKSMGTLGRIIPAITTTTSLMAGLVSVELF
jgi:hypothetical protein